MIWAEHGQGTADLPRLPLTCETFVSVALDRERPGKSQLSLKTRDWMDFVCKVKLCPRKLALSSVCSRRWICLETGRRSWRQGRTKTEMLKGILFPFTSSIINQKSPDWCCYGDCNMKLKPNGRIRVENNNT